MRCADYTDDQALFAHVPTQAESQLHSLKKAAGGIGLYMNANKIEFMCFKQEGRSHLQSKGYNSR